jgi:hypothetical protein
MLIEQTRRKREPVVVDKFFRCFCQSLIKIKVLSAGLQKPVESQITIEDRISIPFKRVSTSRLKGSFK